LGAFIGSNGASVFADPDSLRSTAEGGEFMGSGGGVVQADLSATSENDQVGLDLLYFGTTSEAGGPPTADLFLERPDGSEVQLGTVTNDGVGQEFPVGETFAGIAKIRLEPKGATDPAAGFILQEVGVDATVSEIPSPFFSAPALLTINNSFVQDSIVVSGGPGNVESLGLQVDFFSQRITDTSMFLAPPGTTWDPLVDPQPPGVIDVFVGPGGTTLNGQITGSLDPVLDPLGTLAPMVGTGPHTGVYPATDPGGFSTGILGRPADGTWTLFIEDDRAGANGILNGWALNFREEDKVSGPGLVVSDGTQLLPDGAALDLGTPFVGEGPGFRQVDIRNNGDTELLVNSPEFAAQVNSTISSVSAPPITTLQPGERHSFWFSATPTAAGAFSATASLTHDSPHIANPFTFNLSGTGIETGGPASFETSPGTAIVDNECRSATLNVSGAPTSIVNLKVGFDIDHSRCDSSTTEI